MKIGIYTIHNTFNYGAMFQAYATQKALEKMGFQSEIVNLYTIKEEQENELKRLSFRPKNLLVTLFVKLNLKLQKKLKRFKKFHSEMNLSKRYYTLDEIYKNPPKYDIHLVGSDQVWNLEEGLKDHPFFFLDFLHEGSIKISYASSFGTSTVNKLYYSQLKQLLSTFKAISVREDDGVKIISEATGFEAKQVMDPTFLLSDQDWKILSSTSPIYNFDYIFCYGFDGTPASKDMITSIQRRLNMPIIVISVSPFFPFRVNLFARDAGPKEFINILHHSKFVCSSSYHGIAFAIHFRKSFFSTIHPTRNSRMNCMLNKLGLSNRQLADPTTILNMTNDQLYINYADIENKIESSKNESLAWLRKKIEEYGKKL